MSGPRAALIYVQHLLGIGHLMRAAMLARAFAAAGWTTHLVSGGRAVPGLDTGGAALHQLPPLTAADKDFSGLADGAGNPADDSYLDRRRQTLGGLFADLAPDLLVIEHFPFGRRQMRFELTPLLAQARRARPRPLILCSVRDILVARRQERHAEARDIVTGYFDHVLVHGDPAFVPFDATFPFAADLARRLSYTGFLRGPAPAAAARRGDEILVSSGGGAVGRAIETAALGAAAAWPGPHRWRLLVGANRPAEDIARLAAAAPPRLTVERARPDFRDLLAAAAASVSQAGYNTVMDVFASRVPAVLVPFADARETEQTQRAARLQELGVACLLPETALAGPGGGGTALAAAVETVLGLSPAAVGFAMNGAAASVAIAERLLAGARG